MRDDEIIRRIERFPFRRGPVAAEWRNKGYTLAVPTPAVRSQGCVPTGATT
jgi:hypothetical protein